MEHYQKNTTNQTDRRGTMSNQQIKWTVDHDNDRVVLYDNSNGNAWIDCQDPVDVSDYE